MASTQSTAEIPSIRDRQKALTRRRLLDAARTFFQEQGYDATSVDQIVKLAGTSRATFYLHFTHKPDVAVAIRDEMWEAAEEFFVGLAHLPEWTPAQLRIWMEGDVENWTGKQVVVHALVHSSLGGLGGGRIIERIEAIAEKTVAEGGHWTRWSESEALLRALLVVDALVTYFQHWQTRGFIVGEDFDLDLLARMVGDALGIQVSE